MKSKQPPSTETQKADNQMNTNSNINAASVLETLHPATVKALEGLYFQKFVAAMSSTISAPAAAAAIGANDTTEQPVKRQGRPKGSKNKTTVETPVKRGPGRPAGSKNKAKIEEEVETKAKKTTKDLGPSGRAKAAAGGKRLTTKSGKTASQVIREYDEKHEDAKANDVVAYCHKLGLTNVVPANVYNVRQNQKKAAEAEAAAKAAAKKSAKAKKAAKKTSK
jgi:hypothetical protein